MTTVHLQAEHRGWHTDDVLVVGTTGSGKERTLACQIKRTFTISKSNEDCKKAFIDFWSDFKSNTTFRRDTDAFALVTLHGTNALLRDFTSLLDAARASSDSEDFTTRLGTPGFISNNAKQHALVIRGILEEGEGAIEDETLWQFLRTLHVLSYDLTTSTAQTEGLVKTVLRHATSDADPHHAANFAWLRLVELAAAGMASAKSFVRDDLPEELRRKHSEHAATEFTALQVLAEHSTTILAGIEDTIGESVALPRQELVGKALHQLEQHRVLVITGPAGSGKSVVAKKALEVLAQDHLCFAFRAEEFDAPHLDDTLQRAQVHVTADRLSGILAAQGRKVLLIESVERLLEAAKRESFTDLLQRIRADPSWRLVITCRDYSVEIVHSSLLAHARLGHELLSVPDLTDEELDTILAQLPGLERPADNPRLRRLLRRPYVLNMAARMEWGSSAIVPENERSFRRKFWSEIVREDVHGAGGLPDRRSATFVEIAVRRARALSPLAPCGDLDQEAIRKLHGSNLLLKQTGGHGTAAAPAHDVLEDWAVLHWLDDQFQLHERSVADLCNRCAKPACFA